MKSLFVCVLVGLLGTGMVRAATETYGMVFVCDGAKGDVFYDYAKNGHNGQAILPNIKKYFIDSGAWVRNATTVFPTITGAGMPAVLTGCFPGRHNLPSLYFFDRQTKKYPVLYVPIEALDWDQWLSPDVKTIWEHFEGPDDALSFGPALHRGADEHISIIYNVSYTPMELRGKLKTGWRGLQRKVAGGLPAKMTVVYNGWFDHKEHGQGARSEEQIPEYKAVDEQVGQAVAVFNDVMAERRKEGVDVRYFIALASDHGHQDVRSLASIDDFIAKNEGAKVVEKVWTQLFGQKLKGEIPKDLSGYDLVCASGEGHALLYFPITTNGVRDWDHRPSLSLLRAFPFKGQVLDLPAIAAGRDAVRLVTLKDHASGAVWVVAKKGEATIERKAEGGRTFYRYKIQKGEDPLDLAGKDAAKQLMDDQFHDQREWQLATYDTESPDAIVQLYQVFDSPRAADIFLSAAPFVSIGDLVDGAKSKSKHGGLTRDEAWCTVAFTGTDIPQMEIETARNVDVVPTMLALLGKDYDPSKLDGEPIPALMARVRQQAKLPAGEAGKALAALEAQVQKLSQVQGDGVTAWALAFRVLASRPGLPADRVRALREQAYREIASRGDPAAKAVVAGEVPSEFMLRRRPDLPRTAGSTAVDRDVQAAVARDAADAAMKKMMELMQQAMDAANGPDTDAGKKALAEVDKQLALIEGLRQAGLLDSSPQFSFDTFRSGTNLRYEGMTKGPMTAASRKALTDFIASETKRSTLLGGGGTIYNTSRAAIQAAMGNRLNRTAGVLAAAPLAGNVDLTAVVNALPPGNARDAVLALGDYRATTSQTASATAASAPRAPDSTTGLPAATAVAGGASQAGAPASPAAGAAPGAAGAPQSGRSILDSTFNDLTR